MDGYTRLLYKIFGIEIERPMICRVCGEALIIKSSKGYICVDCEREANRIRTNNYYWSSWERAESVRERGRAIYQRDKDKASCRAKSHYLFPDRQVCSVEGCDKQGHRHHLDYSNYKDIEWLCPLHHKQLHLSLVKV